MKTSILLSAVIGMTSFIGQVQAISVPDASASLDSCLSWAKSQDGAAAINAATTRCYAINNCNKNESEDIESLTECLQVADAAYQSAGGSRTQFGQEVEADVAPLSSGVTTRSADSLYEMKGGDEKGWGNADVGD